MKFEQIVAPAAETPLQELEIAGARLDLHDGLRFIGLTYGDEDATVTMGWAARRETTLRGQGAPRRLAGATLTFIGVSRFEVALQAPPQDAPEADDSASALSFGDLDYFEFRRDPEPALLFFFERGTIRIAAPLARGEVLVEEPPALAVIQ